MVSLLRSEGSDTAFIEAKSALTGLPTGLAPILSAFANRPGGGALILGLDESAGFAACGVYDVKAAQQSVASIARSALDPPVNVATESASFEGHDLVVVQVLESSPSDKPVKVKATGRAYLRHYHGTYTLSQSEEQAFVAARTPPAYDHEPVTGSTRADLDDLAVSTFIRARRVQSSVFAEWTDDRILVQSGAMTADGTPTMAGLLALGAFPQAYYPNLAIQAASWSGPPRAPGSTILDSAVIEGPIPSMLLDAEMWVRRNTSTAITEGPDGNLYDRPQYPERAVRELVANALMHRDLGPYALNRYVNLTLEPGRLVISNPGGLFGITVDALGHTDSSLRNGWLAAVLMNVRTSDGRRVIERLGSGVPATRDAMVRAGLPGPRFYDSGLSFTARLESAGASSTNIVSVSRPTGNQGLVLAALAQGPGTAVDLAARTGLTTRQVRYALAPLAASGQVTTDGSARNAMYTKRSG